MGSDEEGSMRMTPLGPEGIKGRIAEIRSRIEELSGGKEDQPFEPLPQPRALPTGSSGTSGILAGMRGRLVGNPAMATLEGNLPVNPMVGGFGISAAVPEGREAWLPAIKAAAEKNGVDPVLFEALVEQESQFRPRAVSQVGAMGLTQLMPGTAKELGVADPFDPVQNLDGGARYLSQMLKEFGGSEPLALAAYNAGPGAVKKAGGVPPYRETASYVDRITSKIAEKRG